MKFPSFISNLFSWKIEAVEGLEAVELVKQKSFFSLKIIRALGNAARMELLSQKSQEFLEEIKSIGFTKTMDEYEKRKLSIFNQLPINYRSDCARDLFIGQLQVLGEFIHYW